MDWCLNNANRVLTNHHELVGKLQGVQLLLFIFSHNCLQRQVAFNGLDYENFTWI